MTGAAPNDAVLDEAATEGEIGTEEPGPQPIERPVPDQDKTPGASWGFGLAGLIRRHPAFAAVLGVGALLRGVTMFGYRPAMFFNDSFDYLHVAIRPYPHPLRPDGYAFLLWILKPFHSFALVVAIQHLMGLAVGVMIYALLRKKFGLPGWGAALAAAPPLLDAYQIQLEHLILSDVPFIFLVVAAVTLLLWKEQPSWRVAASIGVIIGVAALTRSVGLPVLCAALVFMVARRVRWRMIAVTALACAVPMLAYSGWYFSYHGKFATTESNGIFLFARVYKFADCAKIKPPPEEMGLCVTARNRLPRSQDGIWNAESPLRRYDPERFNREQNARAGDFAKRAIMAQPGDYLKVVAGDFFRVFRWQRTVFPDRATYAQYEFGATANPLPTWRMSPRATAAEEAVEYEQGRARTRVVEPYAGIIRGYQDTFYMRGTILGMILLIGLGGMLPLWRRFGGAALMPWMTAVGLLLAPAATAEFDYRYVLPAVPLACLAAGLAFTTEARGWWSRNATIVRRRRRTPAPAAEKAPEPATASS